jgi:NAD(P)-dependent dehydrogenase (short-subunit alcohol dehydrogenase family)
MGAIVMRLAGKVAIVVGGGQQPGDTMGNGRATAIRFAQEGATVLVVDIDEKLAQETVDIIAKDGGKASAFQADITDEAQCKAIADTCVARYGRIDILHNNVGRSRGDRSTVDMDADVWDELMAMNLKGMFMTCKHVLPVMRQQEAGVIVNISSVASTNATETVTYKTGKGAVNTLTHHLAMENAKYGIRANVILPGLMDTPMAIVRRAKERGVDPDIVRRERDERVPLKQRQGSAWDVANAAVFLASDEAQYITGVALAVDGGLSARIG